jgi:predicted Zn-dependent peptidase
MKTIRPKFLLFLALFLCLSVRTAAADEGTDLEGRIILHTLKNGIKVLMLERHISPTVSFYIRHRTGAVDEPDGKTGMAHFLEHMMFKGTTTIGTKDYSREKPILDRIAAAGRRLDAERKKGRDGDSALIARLTEEIAALQKQEGQWMVSNEMDRLYTENGGLDMNGSTGQDITTFHVSLPANKMELWARIEADRMTNPVLREFYTERDVIREEKRQRTESSPDGRLMEQFLAEAFKAHPYRRPVIGWSADIPTLGMDDMESFIRQLHAPENTVIAIVGDFKTADAIRLVEAYFGPIAPYRYVPVAVPSEPPQRKERRLKIDDDANPRLVIGWHKPAMPAFDDYVMDVIEAVLSQGRTSRFYKKLVEETGLAESVYANNGSPGSRYDNLFTVYARPRHPHDNDEVERAIYREIDRLKTEPVPERELEKVKNRMRADFIKGLNTNAGLASSLSYYECLLGDYRYMTRHSRMVEKITPADIMAVARKYFTAENRTTALMSPAIRISGKGGTP